MNDNNSNALQGHLNPEPQAQSSESADQRPKDIHCPEMVTKGLNSYRQTCVERISARQVALCCRRCEVGKKMAQELNVILTGLKVNGMCDCGQPKEFKKSLCTDCRATNLEESLERAEKVRSAKYKAVDCACGNKRKVNHKYCSECKTRTPQERKNAQKRRKYLKDTVE